MSESKRTTHLAVSRPRPSDCPKARRPILVNDSESWRLIQKLSKCLEKQLELTGDEVDHSGPCPIECRRALALPSLHVGASSREGEILASSPR